MKIAFVVKDVLCMSKDVQYDAMPEIWGQDE